MGFLRHLESTDIPESPIENNSPQVEISQEKLGEAPPRRRKRSLLEALEEKRKASELSSRLVDSENPGNKNAYFNIFEEETLAPSAHHQFLGKRKPLDPEDLAQHHSGKVISRKKKFSGVKVSFACKLNHRFSKTFKHEDCNHEEPHCHSSWCQICQNLFEKAKSFAKNNNGELLSTEMGKVLEFRCSKGHQWSISYKKSQRSWCNRCSKAKKKQQKEKLAQKKKAIEY